MLSYDSYSNRLCASEFKQFLAKDGEFIDGFNDELRHSEVSHIDQNSTDDDRTIEQLKKENERLKAELEQVTPIHPALDPAHKNHAPELLLAVQAWEAKYLENEYPHQEHTPAITNILKNKNVIQVNLVKRICAITNPNK